MSDKLIRVAITEAISGNVWNKFANPSVGRGKTAFPKPADQERLGIRFDYDKLVKNDKGEFHTFKMQANQGKIPSSLKMWRDKNGTDAVMAVVWVKKDATKEDVEAALNSAREEFKS
ncbi:hypothetical protein GGU10DRAFT_366259 [Lentinula aff. detonsa]|uniref:Uncharacterized protein n=1 Tax=Lentinula aff. detonsa TaxID=2804958 RepID=A0AA38KP94_9AGAR|nr:hypothetical protein GGU10DRAFT_366259 [Lentinula aff. detonsa]